jgi:hypothetical protein
MEAVRYSDTVATDVASDGPVRLLDLSRGPVASPSPKKMTPLLGFVARR